MDEITTTKIDLKAVIDTVEQCKPVLEELERPTMMMTGLFIAAMAVKPELSLEEAKGVMRGMSEWISLYFAATSSTKH